MTAEFISIEEYCTHHHTEITFIDALEQSGLIQVVEVEAARCVHLDQLEQLERFTTLYTELEVNIPGIEVVNTLLEKLHVMQHHIYELEHKVRFYEH
jgi:hypothetical protein